MFEQYQAIKTTPDGYTHVNPYSVQPLGPEWSQFFSEDANGVARFDGALFHRWQVATAIRLEYKFNVEESE